MRHFLNQGHYFKNLYSHQGHNLEKFTVTKKKEKEEKVNIKYLNFKNIILMSK